jgi:hypothetical protein
MAFTENVLKYSPPGVPDRLFLQIIPTGNYVTGGDTLNLNPSAFKDPNGIGILGYPDSVPKVPPAPFSWNFTGAYALYEPYVVPGATLGTFKVQIANGGVELGAGAYPAGIAGQPIELEVVFN